MNFKPMEIIVTVLLASFGALARILNQKDTKARRFTNMISGCVVAAFAGLMAHFITTYLALDPNLAYVVAGISGWIGPQAIDAITSIAMKKAGIDIKNVSDKP